MNIYIYIYKIYLFLFHIAFIFCLYVFCVKESDPLNYRLQVVMNCHVSAGN